MANIEWTTEAVRDLEKLDRAVAKRIVRKTTWLSENFEQITPEPLSGDLSGTYKLRVGSWRVIYTIENLTLVIRFIGHRKEIYQS